MYKTIYRKAWFLIFAFFLTINAIRGHNQVIEHESSNLKTTLNWLTLKEQEDLKLFFHNLFAESELGYTLFGEKPMSFCALNTFCPNFSHRDFTYKIYDEDAKPLFKGFSIWQKLSQGIKPNNYLLIILAEKHYPHFAILVNKRTFEKEFLKNIDLFQKYYGKNVTAEHILSNLESKKNYKEIIKTPLFHNDVLLGVMLGFGRHNAELFQRREELTKPKFSLTFFSLSRVFSSNEEEVQYLWQHLQLTRNSPDFLLKVTGVGFVGDLDDPETHTLVKKYESLHNELIFIFDRHDWLEVILGKLLEK